MNYKNGVNGEFVRKRQTTQLPMTQRGAVAFCRTLVGFYVREVAVILPHHMSALEATGAHLGDHGRTALRPRKRRHPLGSRRDGCYRAPAAASGVKPRRTKNEPRLAVL